MTVYCSRWLAIQCRQPEGQVLYQAVTIPPRPILGDVRALRDGLVVGRICTPTNRKWPAALIPFYGQLAASFPQIDWEFVGCPPPLQALLLTACQGRARFHAAGWCARTQLWRWDALLYHHPELSESFGRVVAESLRSGCIPLVDAQGGFQEQFPADAGFLCATEAEFSQGLQQILDVGVRRRISRRAQTHGNEQFSLSRFQQDLLRLFKAAASAGPSTVIFR